MIGVDPALQVGAGLTVLIRATGAAAAARAAGGGWPLWRSGPAAAVLLLHDTLVGAALFGALAVLPTRVASDVAGPGGSVPSAVAVLGTVVGLLLAPRVLERRHGLRRHRAGGSAGRQHRPTLRGVLLLAIERGASRAVCRWIADSADRCRQRSGTSPEQLLPALWPPVRQVLRESVGVGRAEIGMLMGQAQAVLDDPAPAQDRLLTLLHLVHLNAGRPAVRAVLAQAGRVPVRVDALVPQQPEVGPDPVSPAVPDGVLPATPAEPVPDPGPAEVPPAGPRDASGLTVDLTLVPDFGASPRRDPAGPDVAFGRGA